MCLICIKPAGKTLTKKQLKVCFQNNSHGAGFMYSAENKLNVLKGFMSFRKFYKAFRQQEGLFPESTFVIHFRINACGGVSAENTHPFFVNPNLAIVHNGVISELGSATINDTRAFTEQLLAKLPDRFLDNQEIKAKIEEVAVKSLSKFVFLDNTGKYTIVNEQAGIWDDGMWFSNTSYKTYGNTTWDYGVSWLSGSSKPYEQRGFAKTYRECTVCGLYHPLTRLTWKSGTKGWICEWCLANEPLQCNHDKPEKFSRACRACGDAYSEEDGIRLDRGLFYCNECWSVIKHGYTVVCPYCGSNVVMDEEDNCTFCGGRLEKEDYELQLDNACFFEF